MAPQSRIGTRIRRARERRRMSQADLAEKLGVSRSAVNSWENDRAYPLNSIGALEEILGITLDDEPAADPLLVPLDDHERLVLSMDTLTEDDMRLMISSYRKAKAEAAARSTPTAGAVAEPGSREPGLAS